MAQAQSFFENTNTTDSEEQWQVFPFNSSVYVLRTKASGSEGYLGTGVGKDEDTPGKTVPIMVSAIQADDSIFWHISPWGDGTFYFTNAANGTAWHLTVKSNSLMAMTSNISVQQDAQSFSFLQLGTIDDASFNSVVTPLSTSAGSSTTSSITTSTSITSTTSPAIFYTTSSVSTPSPTQPAASHRGLSAGTSAAIGASIGGVALIAGVILAYIMYKRRKRKAATYTSKDMAWKVAATSPKELYIRQDARELEVPPAELHEHYSPAEFPGHWNRS